MEKMAKKIFDMQIRHVVHRNKKRLALIFSYDKHVVSMIRDLPDARWSATMGCWHVPDEKGMIENLNKKLGNVCNIGYKCPVRMMDESRNPVRS